ncbi:hypothetical protein NDI52_33035 [Leptolyngbya sp. PL-A3]
MADAGNSFRQARSISPKPGLTTLRERLSSGDRNDYYRFNLRSASSFDAFVSGIQRGSNFDLLLFNGSQRLIRRSAKAGNANEALNLRLARGTWYLRVQWKAGNSAYNLRFSANPDRAGSTLGAARNLGTLPATAVSYNDYVGTSDRLDFYKFNVTNRTSLRTTLTPFASTTNFSLYNSAGTVLGSRSGAGTAAKNLIRTLAPGTYYVGVRAGGAAVRYSLRLLGSPIVDTAGNTIENAKVLPVSFAPSSYAEFVGTGDPLDLYKFETMGGNLVLSLTGLESGTNLKIDLLNSSGIYAGISSDLVNGVETLTAEDLNPGTYYIQVKPNPSTASSVYTLNYQLLPPDNVEDTQELATQITAPNNSPLFPALGAQAQDYRDFVGGGDEDWYKFDFTGQASNFLSIRLNELASTVNMEFFKAGSSNRIFTSSGNAGQGAFEGTVGEGIYYLRVYAPGVNTGSTYNLQMSVNSGNNRPSITRDIYPDGDSGARLLQEVRTLSTLFFVATDGQQLGLWRTGGTLDTTIRVGVFDSIDRLQAVGGTLYIAGDLAQDAFGSELYKWTTVASSDPNVALAGQISLVKDIAPGTDPGNENLPLGSGVTGMTAIGNYLYFLASPTGASVDQVLYRTDGTGAGTVQIANAGNSFGELTAVGTTLYYQAAGAVINGSPSTNSVLWRIANATSTTTPTATALPSLPQGTTTVNLRSVSGLRAIGNDLYFIASEPANQANQTNREWRRLTGAGTLQTLDASGDFNSSLTGVAAINQTLAVVGNYAYFTASAGEGIELFRTDLTSGSTEPLPQINNLPNQGGNPSSLTVYNDQLFFSALDTEGDTELYVITEPTIASPTITKVNLFGGTDNSSSPRDFRVAGGKLYFVATGTSGTEVYSYDKANSSTTVGSYSLVVDIAPDANSSNPLNLVVVGDTAGDGSQGRIYFTADNGISGREVWVI